MPYFLFYIYDLSGPCRGSRDKHRGALLFLQLSIAERPPRLMYSPISLIPLSSLYHRAKSLFHQFFSSFPTATYTHSVCLAFLRISCRRFVCAFVCPSSRRGSYSVVPCSLSRISCIFCRYGFDAGFFAIISRLQSDGSA